MSASKLCETWGGNAGEGRGGNKQWTQSHSEGVAIFLKSHFMLSNQNQDKLWQYSYLMSQAHELFCLLFQAESWSECVDTTIELKHVFRQKDPLFISILQNVRVGR